MALNLETKNHKMYYSHLNDESINLVIATGCPGSGKTFMACQYALNELNKNRAKRVIVTKPIVSVANEELGALPGNVAEKVEPWLQSISTNIKNKRFNSHFEFVPLGYMRGQTFDNAIIIADEMQNSTPEQMLMLLTRVGIRTKVILTGDVHQKDILMKSGLEDLLEKLYNVVDPEIASVEFVEEDIERSDFVKKILNIYKKKIIVPNTLQLYKEILRGRNPESNSSMF